MTNYLRVHSAGEVLRDAAHIYRKNTRVVFWTFMLPMAPAALLYGFVSARSSLGLGSSTAVNVLALALLFLCSIFSTAPLTIVLADICVGNSPSVIHAYRRAFDRSVGRLIGTFLLSLAIIMVGMLFLLVPGMVFAIWFSFVLTVGVLERRYGPTALKRSKELGKGFYWRNFCVLFLCQLSVQLIVLAIALVAGILAAVIMTATSSKLPLFIAHELVQLIALIFLPLPLITTVLLYYDMRVRKEAYDSTALAEDLRR